jgi:hypothetical protein
VQPLALCLLVTATLILALGMADVASAQNVCTQIGGTVDANSGECQVSTARTVVGGTYNLPMTLHILSGGSLNVPLNAANLSQPSVLNLNITGDLVMDVGARIVGDTGSPNPNAIGATLNITASDDITLSGDGGGASATITSNSDSLNCVSGNGGAITLTATGGRLTTGPGTRIASNGQCTGGAITLRSADNDMTVNGLVQSAAGSTAGSGQIPPRGGPITLSSAVRLTIGSAAQVSSSGSSAGADLVHLESGNDMMIRGIVESVGGVTPVGIAAANPVAPLPNLCASYSRFGFRDPGATACVELWVAGSLVVDATNGNNAYVLAKTGQAGGAVGQCCGWIDMVAHNNVTLNAWDNSLANKNNPLMVDVSQQSSQGGSGGKIRIQAIKGKYEATGKALTAAGPAIAGGTGGLIKIEAGGPIDKSIDGVPDPNSNINLNNSWSLAFGGTSRSGGQGSILMHSFNGNITGGTLGKGSFLDANYTVPNPSPDTAYGEINMGVNGANQMLINLCAATGVYYGYTLPLPTVNHVACGGQPQPDPFITVPPFQLPKPTIVVIGGEYAFDPSNPIPRPGAATAYDENNNPLLDQPLSFTYFNTDTNTPMGSTPPTQPGNYTVTATYPGDSVYRSVTGTAIIKIFPASAPSPIVTTCKTDGSDCTFTYDGLPHAGFVRVTDKTTGVLVTDAPAVLSYRVRGTTTFSTTVPVNSGTYDVQAVYTPPAGSAYGPASATGTLIISKVPTKVVMYADGAAYDGTGLPHPVTIPYDGNPHTAIGYVVLTNNAFFTNVLTSTITYNTLDGLPPRNAIQFPGNTLPATATATGTYGGDANHLGSTGSTTITLTPGRPIITPVGYGPALYDTFAHPGSGTIIGVNGEDLSGLVCTTPPCSFSASTITTTVDWTNTDTGVHSSTPPVNPGNYTINLAYKGSNQYQALTASAPIIITALSPAVSVTVIGSSTGVFTYDGTPKTASGGTVDAKTPSKVLTAPTIYYMPFTSNPACPPAIPPATTSAPINAGTYTVVAYYLGSATGNTIDKGYGPGCATTTLTINPVPTSVSVTGGTFVYNGSARPSAVTLSPASVGSLTLTVPAPVYSSGGAPVNVGTYGVTATYVSQSPGNILGSTAANTITITPITPLITAVGGKFQYQAGTERLGSATATSPGGGTVAGTMTFAYSVVSGGPLNTAGHPELVGTYSVKATFTPSDPNYTGTVSATATITIQDTPVEACFVVDFDEITYFNGGTVLSSGSRSNPTGLDPTRWTTAGGTTRPKQFRIYGFRPDQINTGVSNVTGTRVYPVQFDQAIPGGSAYYIDLGGPDRVFVCPSQLQNYLIDQRVPGSGAGQGVDDAGGDGALPAAQADPSIGVLKYQDTPDAGALGMMSKDVPGIMLNYQAMTVDVPQKVRDQLTAAGISTWVDAQGNPITRGRVGYIGLQLWDRTCTAGLHDFVNAKVIVVADEAGSGFHSVKNIAAPVTSSCGYVDSIPTVTGGVRMNDVWDGDNVGNPQWGPACGILESAVNRAQRENYAIDPNEAQLLPTVGGSDVTSRVLFGTITPIPNPPAAQTSVNIGPSSMEGAIKLMPGQWVSGGYSFKTNFPSPATFTVTATVSIAGKCSGGTMDSDTFVIPLGTKTFSVPKGQTDWLPTGDQNNILSWQGALQVPVNVCGGGSKVFLDGSKGAVFNATISASPNQTGAMTNWRFHYRDPAAKGKGNVNCTDATNPKRNNSDVCGASWSGTANVVMP